MTAPTQSHPLELLDAAKALRDDLINRAKNYEQEDAIPVVAPGNGVWMKFCEAIAKADKALSVEKEK